MMKKTFLLKPMLLLLAMIAGVGSVWGETVTFTAGTDTSEGTSITKDGITVSFSSGVFNRTDNYRCYSGASMTISSIVGTMTQIDFEATSSNPMTKFNGDPDVGQWNNDDKTQWVGSATEINFGATSGQARITKITVTYTPSPVSTHNVTLPKADDYGTYTMDATNPVATGTQVALTYTPATGYENYQATWSVNGTAISGNKFTMPDENVTVTVAVAEVQDYATLPFSWAGGTSADLMAEQGVSAYGLGGDYAESHAPYRVKLDNDGDYIQIKTDGLPGKVSIGVKMIGGKNTSKITVQGSADGTTFMDVEELEISGSQNDVLTLETSNAFAATDRYVRLVFKRGSNVGVGSITIAKPSTDPAVIAESSVELEASATSGEFEYSIINPVSGTTLSASTQANWITNVTVGTDKVTFNTTANDTGTERSAVITLTYGSLTKEVTITQAKYIETVTYTLATSVTPGKHYIIANGTEGDIMALGKQTDNYREQVSVTADEGTLNILEDAGVYEFLIKVDDATGHYTLYDVVNEKYLYANSNSSNNVNIEETLDKNNNGLWAIDIDIDAEGVASIVAQGKNSRNTLRYNEKSSRFSCYAEVNSMADIYLFERVGDESAEQTTIAVAPTKEYTTFARAIDLDFTNVEGIEAYVVSDLTDNSAVVTKVDKVAAGEGVILKKTGDAASFEIPFAESAEKVSGNKLVGVTVATDMTEVANAYILSDGLFYACSGGTLAAGKAYLVAADWAESTAPSFSIVEGGEATGIKSLTPALSQGEEVYYDLSGRRVAQPTNGVYIVNGKKVLVP